MKTQLLAHLKRLARPVFIAGISLCFWGRAEAVTNVFFNASQTAIVAASNITSITLSSSGYLFTYSVDGYWSASPGGPPTGRFFTVFWPTGVQAQAVTTGPSLGKARISLKRQDGQPFAIHSFTAKLLANTSGAGAAIEVMPKLNGEDTRPDPYPFPATGSAGQSFSYQTPQLSGADTYDFTLYVDFALMNLIAVDASLPPPQLEMLPLSAAEAQIFWPAEYPGFVLQQNSALEATNWVPAAEAVNLVGDSYQATISLTNGARFFRLRSTP